MNTPTNPHDRLERLLNETLRDQPSLRAPSSLEARVFAQIEAQLARPWWRKSFAHWPSTARLGFVLACAALVRVGFLATMWISTMFGSNVSGKALSATFAPEITLARIVPDVFSTLVSHVPVYWLYGVGAACVFSYLVFFGVGALAYRTLYAPRTA
jgi:hypothetical protein